MFSRVALRRGEDRGDHLENSWIAPYCWSYLLFSVGDTATAIESFSTQMNIFVSQGQTISMCEAKEKEYLKSCHAANHEANPSVSRKVVWHNALSRTLQGRKKNTDTQMIFFSYFLKSCLSPSCYTLWRIKYNPPSNIGLCIYWLEKMEIVWEITIAKVTWMVKLLWVLHAYFI